MVPHLRNRSRCLYADNICEQVTCSDPETFLPATHNSCAKWKNIDRFSVRCHIRTSIIDLTLNFNEMAFIIIVYSLLPCFWQQRPWILLSPWAVFAQFCKVNQEYVCGNNNIYWFTYSNTKLLLKVSFISHRFMFVGTWCTSFILLIKWERYPRQYSEPNYGIRKTIMYHYSATSTEWLHPLILDTEHLRYSVG